MKYDKKLKGSSEARLSLVEPPAKFPSDLLHEIEGALNLFVVECSRSAPKRKQPIFALSVGIALFGALAGRRYAGPTNLRTNHYTVLLGDSSSGKGHPQKVADKLLSATNLHGYRSGDWSSGQSIKTELAKHPVRFQKIDEIGIWLESVTGAKAAGWRSQMKLEAMKLWSLGDAVYEGTAYADGELKRQDVVEPCLCIAAAGTPERFYGSLRSGAMRDGFIPRLLVFKPDEYLPPLVKGGNRGRIVITDELRDAAKLIAAGGNGGNLATASDMKSDTPPEFLTIVQYGNGGEEENNSWEDRYEEVMQAGCPGFVSKELVGKLGEHAGKLALVFSISRNPRDPVLDKQAVRWGWRVAEFCMQTVNVGARMHMADNNVEADRNEVRNAVEAAGPKGVLRRDLLRALRHLKAKELSEVIDALLESGEVFQKDRKVGARHPYYAEKFR